MYLLTPACSYASRVFSLRSGRGRVEAWARTYLWCLVFERCPEPKIRFVKSSQATPSLVFERCAGPKFLFVSCRKPKFIERLLHVELHAHRAIMSQAQMRSCLAWGEGGSDGEG